MSWTPLSSAHQVKIRKKRYCEWCERTWPVGSPMITWTGVHDGSAPQRTYMCIICHEYCEMHWDEHELPTEPFWYEDVELYSEFDIKHSLRLVVADLPMIKELYAAQLAEQARRRAERIAAAERKAKS